ncbi:30S ribosomal protein S4e [Candidatus Nitrosotenuis uzonensis]|uniref:Small ribosomal subunit protein eS4 n=1 Tax=Candidatus Nitrosotenuis uzonensis TaxID=1407055 RepID=V6AS70_9ARCH|nr:30S ribosomal protein S4e [Candidatus Nitrosotenuis uzonensis]CDI05566.1 Ribosomal protein S4E, central domain protein [Candidatus Nitrosotenuis uzonensis]
MPSIAGSKKLKRQMAPMFWGISRKRPRFVTTVRPGPHGKNVSIPTKVFLRDMLKLVTTAREAHYAIYNGKVKIDGITRKSIHHGIGLMDVIELDGVSDAYRLVPGNGHILHPIKIKNSEKNVKLVKVTTKSTIKSGKTQLGFHDGRSLLSDVKINVGDSCLMQVPEQKINEVIKLEQGSKVIVTKGVNAGQVAEVKEIKEGTFILPKRVLLSFGQREIEIPAELVMAVGKKEPIIQIA